MKLLPTFLFAVCALETPSVMSMALSPAPSSSCVDNHAICTEGDSLRRLQDLLTEECEGVEPGGDDDAALAFAMSELKRCQDQLKGSNCAKELYHSMSSDPTQLGPFCQGLDMMKSMSLVVLKQMCPDTDVDRFPRSWYNPSYYAGILFIFIYGRPGLASYHFIMSI